MNEDRLGELMVKAADDCASPAELEELMDFIVDKPDLRRELEEHKALKAVTDGWVERLELDLVEDRHSKSGMARAEYAIGLALFLGGSGILAGWWLVALLSDSSVPLAVRLGVGALSGGFLVLLFSVIRWRLQTHRSDRYNEVIR